MGAVVCVGLCGPCATAEGYEPSPETVKRWRDEARA